MRMRVVGANVLLDLFDQIFNTFECPSADRFLGDLVEPNLHLIEPGGVGRDVMHMPAAMERQPAFDPRMLVRAVVIDYHVDIELPGNILVYTLEKVQILLVAVTVCAFGEHPAVGNV